MILAMMLLGTALAQDSGEATRTLSCSAAVPSWAVACFVETPVATVGPIEFAIGFDARALLSEGNVDFAPYGIAAYYAPTWNAWVEVALPNVTPIIGRPDPFRAGVTLRF
jgi:hypothetical protein